MIFNMCCMDEYLDKIRSLGSVCLLCVFVLLLLPVAGLRAGETPGTDRDNSIRFEHLSTEEGLSYPNVYGIFQDSGKFMWFATKYGLNRYDGMEFTVFTHDPDDPASLGDNYVWNLFEDSRGTLWIVTYGGGLDTFDPATESFGHHRHDPKNPASLSSDLVWCVYEDSRGNLWVGSEGGLSRFDPVSESFTHHTHRPNDPTSLSHNTVTMIAEDASGFLWLGTFGGGLNRFDPRTGLFTRYRHRPENPHSLSNDKINSVLIDRRNTLWIGTENGLNSFDPSPDGSGGVQAKGEGQSQGEVKGPGGNFIHHFNAPDNPGSLSHNRVRALYEDGGGTLWVGTSKGLNRHVRDDGSFIRYQAHREDPNSLSHNSVYYITGDTSGGLWVGTANGVSKAYPGNQGFGLSMSGLQVHSVHEGEDGTLWVGTGQELKRIRRTPAGASTHGAESEITMNLSGTVATRILPAGEGTFWIATLDGGLNKYDTSTGSNTYYRHDPDNPDGLHSNAILDIAAGKEGVLWIATSNSGVERFDPKDKTFTHFPHDSGNPDSLVSNWTRTVFVDSAGTLWIGTEGGVSRLDPAGGAFTNFKAERNDPASLSNSVINMFCESSKGGIWIATNDGLNRFNPESGTFTVYRKKNGLPGNSIAAILEDTGGNLWLSTNNGLSVFDPAGGSFKNYDQLDGLQGRQFMYHSAHRSPDGKLFFGGLNGLNAFYPERLADNPHIPPVYLTDFQLFNQPVAVGGDSPLKKRIGFTSRLTLSHEQSVFSFGFVALNYRASAKNRYAYMMEGVDEGWTYTSSFERTAKYMNLNPGTYRFRVKGSNNDGLWNERGTAVRVVVLPAWWETRTFRGIMVLALLALVIAVYRWRVHAMEARRRKLELLVKERTAALKAGEETLSAILAASPVGIGLMKNHAHGWANESMFRMLGYKEDELIGRSAHILYPDRGEYERVSREMDTIMDRGGIGIFETRWMRKDGTEFDCDLQMCALDKTDPGKGYIAVVSDITERKGAEQEREKLIEELRKSFHRIKKLSGLLPICASCKKIRDDKGYWNQIESYIRAHSEAEFSHSICPECTGKLYPEFRQKDDR